MKAQGMSIGVVITAALAVMVLLMVGGFMSGGFGALTGKITGFVGSGPSAEDTGKAVGCSAGCSAWKAANCPTSGNLLKGVAEGCMPVCDDAATPPVTKPGCYDGGVTGLVGGGAGDTAYTAYGCKLENKDAANETVTCGSCSCDTGKGGAWGQ